MDKFDLQIAMLRPTKGPATKARRLLMTLMALATLVIVVGALRRDLLGVLGLTFRYLGEIPSMFTEYSQAYTATISWPSVIAICLLAALGILLARSRKDITGAHSKRTFRYAGVIAVLALVLGFTGLAGSSTHAHAQQQLLRRTLNERGHLEVQVDGKDYELNGSSQASDASIRNQALIQEIRGFNITTAYPELENMNTQGFVVQVRAVNKSDDCVFYVERRLEPALNKVIDANSGCIRHPDHSYYLNQDLKPISAPDWQKGQTMYMIYAHFKDPSKDPYAVASVIFLLDGNADDYVAVSNSEKLVPKGQSGETERCGIHMQEICPKVGFTDVFTNPKQRRPAGKKGDAQQADDGTSLVQFFGTITHIDDQQLQLDTPSGSHLTITWPENYIAKFNASEAAGSSTQPLHITEGDHLVLMVYYKDGADATHFSTSDVAIIGLAIKSLLPDPLSNQPYVKTGNIEKY
jgi:hypothetical protein